MNAPNAPSPANPPIASAAVLAPHPSPGRELRVFLADDHQIFREGQKTMINFALANGWLQNLE